MFLIFGVFLSGSLKNQIIKNVNKKPIVARDVDMKRRTKEVIKEIEIEKEVDNQIKTVN